MGKDIGTVDDLPDFGHITPPTIDPAAQAEVDAALDNFEASLVVLKKSFKAAEDARLALLSWAALAEKVVDMVGPIISGYIARQNAPDTAAPAGPNKFQAALPGLLGLITTPAAGRPAAIQALLQGLL